MKKFSLLFCLFFIAASTQAIAQKQQGNGNVTTQERSISSYEGLNVSGSFNVEMISSMNGKLSITTDKNLLESIVTEVKDDVLIIRNKKKHYLRPSGAKKVIIKVPMADVNNVKLSGSGKIYADSAIAADSFKASSAGSGKIELSIKAETVSARLAGSGKINLKGSATNIKVKHAGSGSVRLQGIQAKNGTVSLAGSGSVYVRCSHKLDVSVAGSGSVRYFGEPKDKLHSKVAGSGSVRLAIE